MSRFVKQMSFVSNNIVMIKMRQGYFIMMYTDGLMYTKNPDLLNKLNKDENSKILQDNCTDEMGNKMVLFQLSSKNEDHFLLVKFDESGKSIEEKIF
jgi:hypothetical protein